MTTENVFYCGSNETHGDRIVTSLDDELLCALCGQQMEQAGWFQSEPTEPTILKGGRPEMENDND